MDNHEENHITPYIAHAKVLVFLLALTFLTIAITGIHLGAFTVAAALLIACVKGFTVLTYFMHLKYEEPIFRILVIGVFLLFFLIIGITFFDYAFR